MATQSKNKLSVSEFRKRFTSLVDHLPVQGLVITRRGRPVAKLVPLVPGAVDNRRLFGALKGVLTVNDDILSTGDSWNAES